jgi:hypothetical protein
MAHKNAAATQFLSGKNHSKPTLTKKIFGCAEDLLRNDETLGWPTIGAGPGDETAPSGRPGRAPRAGHTWPGTMAIPRLGTSHCGPATVRPGVAPPRLVAAAAARAAIASAACDSAAPEGGRPLCAPPTGRGGAEVGAMQARDGWFWSHARGEKRGR